MSFLLSITFQASHSSRVQALSVVKISKVVLSKFSHAVAGTAVEEVTNAYNMPIVSCKHSAFLYSMSGF